MYLNTNEYILSILVMGCVLACHEIYTKKASKKINSFVYILTDFGIGSLVIIYIGHYFLPIAKGYIHIDTTSSACMYLNTNKYILSILVMGCVLTSTPTWEQSHLLCSRLGTIYNKQYVGHLTP
jgi:hypothetical protein